MEFRILGSLEVRTEGQSLQVGTPMMRAVLALLLVRAGSLVTVDQFVDELWTESRPDDARLLAQGYISRLRKSLDARAGTEDPSARLVSHRPGYVLRVEAEELDQRRFEQLIAKARRARQAGWLGRCVEWYRQAQAEWRGEPFADVPGTPALDRETARLQELRLLVLEELFDTELALGNDTKLLPELREHAARHPLRGHATGQLMVALHRSARTAEALETYHQSARRLADELGLDPPAELRRLYTSIVRDEPGMLSVLRQKDREPDARPGTGARRPGRAADDQPAREVTAVVPTLSARTHHPLCEIYRTYLTATPDPFVHPPYEKKRRIWLADGSYNLWQFMDDVRDLLVASRRCGEGFYEWRNTLVPDTGGRYLHVTTLIPEFAEQPTVVWKAWWRLSSSGLHTWGAEIDPEV
ncbi:AfsR/SARP family transcriptional regulator [Flindersiella endophytica]